MQKYDITLFNRSFVHVILLYGSVRSPLTLIMVKAQYFKDWENPSKIPLWSYVWYIKQTVYAKSKWFRKRFYFTKSETNYPYLIVFLSSIFCSCADWFVSEQVRSTEDRFSYHQAHIKRKTRSHALKVLSCLLFYAIKFDCKVKL